MEKIAITNPAINEYSELFSDKESAVLKALNDDTNKNVHGAQMLSGALQASLLEMISHLVKPKNILELGTYTGYSAIALAQGLQAGGQLHTIDTDSQLQPMRDKYWMDAGLQQKIVQHIGKAIDVIPTLDVQFDLVFIDADKGNYSNYFEMLIDVLPIGACILADNVLFDGEVVLPLEQQSKSAKAVHEFNEKVMQSDRVARVVVPIRDGLTIIRKIK